MRAGVRRQGFGSRQGLEGAQRSQIAAGVRAGAGFRSRQGSGEGGQRLARGHGSRAGAGWGPGAADPALTDLPDELDLDALVLQPLVGVLESQAHLPGHRLAIVEEEVSSFFPSSVLCSARRSHPRRSAGCPHPRSARSQRSSAWPCRAGRAWGGRRAGHDADASRSPGRRGSEGRGRAGAPGTRRPRPAEPTRRQRPGPEQLVRVCGSAGRAGCWLRACARPAPSARLPRPGELALRLRAASTAPRPAAGGGGGSLPGSARPGQTPVQ